MSDRRTALILRHGHRLVPRYTSYPTAPHFTPANGPAQYRRWLAGIEPGKSGSLYIHVPFCRTLCWYCGCTTRATQKMGPVHAYLDLLEQELRLVAGTMPHRLPLTHIHWGGGSPTMVPPDRFASFMNLVRDLFDIRPDAEIAVECDPRQVSAELAGAMAESGVNRASLGIQTFDAEVQRAINRVQPFGQVQDCVETLRAAGIGDINADLLFGLPGQTTQSAEDSTRQALELRPQRAAIFGYAHVPAIRKHQRLIREADLPGATERLRQADAMGRVMMDAGYREVGLDHYTLPGDSMAVALDNRILRRNFQGYTTDGAEILIGIGTSAIGSLPAGYLQNSPDVRQWSAAIESGEFAVARGLALTPEDRMRREIIEQLMCYLEVDAELVAAQHCLPTPDFDLGQLEAEGVAEVRGSQIRIRPEYRLLSRVAASAFDEYLGAGVARHSVAV